MRRNRFPNVLMFSAYYSPGFRGGGPIRTISNQISKLEREIDFSLVTGDRDLGGERAYEGIASEAWLSVNESRIYYASPEFGWQIRLWKIIESFKGDVMHLNSFFSFRFSILPMVFWRLLKRELPVIVGPRGEFSQGALALKSPKKRAFFTLAKVLGLYRHVIWHASTTHEAADIRRVMGNDVQIRIAIDIACPPPFLTIQPRQAGVPLRLVFVSRISPKKNLLGAIQMLWQVQCPLLFDVYGPAEDAEYWASCEEAAKYLPAHVHFNYCGVMYPAHVAETMARYDLFYLPTLGENFGHVIAEALGCGLPLLIADTTPWRNLAQQKLGWDLPLSQPDEFAAAIESCSQMPAADYQAWRHIIRAWAVANIGNDEAVEQNRQLFMNLDIANEH